MTYGDTGTFWVAVELHGAFTDSKPVVFESEKRARDWAVSSTKRDIEWSIYRCQLIGHCLHVEPEFLDVRPKSDAGAQP